MSFVDKGPVEHIRYFSGDDSEVSATALPPMIALSDLSLN